MRFGFLVAGRADDGLGHVSRSLGLASNLASIGHLVRFAGPLSKAALHKVIKAGFHYSRSPSWDVDIVVIDAIELDDELTAGLGGSQKKVLISPKFMQPDLIDFVFSRVTTSTVAAVVQGGGQAFVDPMFAFSGISVVDRLAPIASRARTIGVCISGGESYVDLSIVMNGVAAVDSVARVVVVGHDISDNAFFSSADICQVAKTTDLWATFDSIDFLITGDGVTMFESMARGIPTLSIGREGAAEKNRFFYDENWCAYLSADNLKSEAISRVVSDLDWASTTSHNLLGKDLRSYEKLMAKKIEKVMSNANGFE